jgi:hypothetical protein
MVMNRRPYLCAAALAVSACAARTMPSTTPAPNHAAVTAPAEPTTLRYSTGASHYRLESQSHIEQEMMGQSTKVDITTAMLVTAAIADASGNLGVGITIDSLAITLPPGAPAPAAAELAAARGKTVRLVTSPQGQMVSLTPPDSATALVQQVTQGFREFLPLLPPGSLAAGTTWSDSATMTTPTQIGPATVHTTRQHRVLGWEDHGGARALHLTTISAYTLSGSGEAQGQTIEVSGGGQRTADSFVSAAGVYLGGTLSDSSLVNANVVSAGMVIPVRTTTRSSLTRLP